MKDPETDKKMICASDAIVGNTYLTAGMYYKVKIISINGNPEAGYIASVTVESETDPLRRIQISGDTKLIEFNEKLYKPILIPVREKVDKKERINKEKANMPQQKNPRSKIIDQMLFETSSGVIPDWEAIATAVIEAGCAPEEKRKSIISQSKTRHKWYMVEGKINPMSGAAPVSEESSDTEPK